MWRLTRTSSYSYTRVAEIRIDVHPIGENLINTTRMLPVPVHVHQAYASCRQSPYVATFHADPAELDGCTAPEKKCSRLHLSTRLSGPRDLPQFLSQQNHLISALQPSIYWQHAILIYWAHKHQHAIGTFNTCSRGPTYQKLIDTGGGYNLARANFAHHCPRPSQPMVLQFPPNGHARSQVIHPNITNWTDEGTNPKSREWDFSTRLLL
jgi:hypothetical protein